MRPRDLLQPLDGLGDRWRCVRDLARAVHHPHRIQHHEMVLIASPIDADRPEISRHAHLLDPAAVSRIALVLALAAPLPTGCLLTGTEPGPLSPLGASVRRANVVLLARCQVNGMVQGANGVRHSLRRRSPAGASAMYPADDEI